MLTFLNNLWALTDGVRFDRRREEYSQFKKNHFSRLAPLTDENHIPNSFVGNRGYEAAERQLGGRLVFEIMNFEVDS